jgi:transglutaminase-like putative cysteine protease
MKKCLAILYSFLLIVLCLSCGNRVAARIAGGHLVEIQYTLSWDNDEVGEIKFTAFVPQSIKNRQLVDSLSYSIKPARFFCSNGNKYAEFHIMPRNYKDKRAVITVKAVVSGIRFDLSRNAARRGLEKNKAYLAATTDIASEDPEVIAIARRLKGGDDIQTIRNIHDFVRRAIPVIERDTFYDTKEILKIGKGDCTEHSTLFTAIARAAGLPTMQVCGLYVPDDANYDGNNQHIWNEVYTKEYGWLLVDSSYGNMNYFYPSVGYLYFANYTPDKSIDNYILYEYKYKAASPVKITVVISSKAFSMHDRIFGK